MIFYAMRFALGALACFALSEAAAAQAAQQEIDITATVPKSCTIDGASTGTPDTATIDIDSSGNVVTTPFAPDNAPYLNVVCNAPSTIQLTSDQGAVKNTATASGFTNIIDYQASATWNGVTATIDTSSTATATGPESGTAEPVTGGTGELDVTITPLTNGATPLVGGSYADSLFVTLTPQ